MKEKYMKYMDLIKSITTNGNIDGSKMDWTVYKSHESIVSDIDDLEESEYRKFVEVIMNNEKFLETIRDIKLEKLKIK